MKITLHTYLERKEFEIDTDLVSHFNPRLGECWIHFLNNTSSIRVHEDINEIKKKIKQASKNEQ